LRGFEVGIAVVVVVRLVVVAGWLWGVIIGRAGLGGVLLRIGLGLGELRRGVVVVPGLDVRLIVRLVVLLVVLLVILLAIIRRGERS